MSLLRHTLEEERHEGTFVSVECPLCRTHSSGVAPDVHGKWKCDCGHVFPITPPAAPTPLAREAVNHPKHYTTHPSGVECITVVEHMGFNLGNAVKYIWRADEKGSALENLRKAAWYVQREIEKRSRK